MAMYTKAFYEKREMPFEYNGNSLRLESDVQKCMSNFLIEIKDELTNESLKAICDFESALFDNASGKFLQLSNNTKSLQEVFSYKSTIKAFIEAREKIGKVTNTLDEIISIQEQIIAGSSS